MTSFVTTSILAICDYCDVALSSNILRRVLLHFTFVKLEHNA